MTKLFELIMTVSPPIIIINTLGVIAVLLWVIFDGNRQFTLTFIGLCMVCVNSILISAIIVCREGYRKKSANR